MCNVHFDGLKYDDIKLLSTVDNANEKLERPINIHNICFAQPMDSLKEWMIPCILGSSWHSLPLVGSPQMKALCNS